MSLICITCTNLHQAQKQLQCGYVDDVKKSEFFNEFNRNKFHSSLKEKKDKQVKDREQEMKAKPIIVDTTYHLCYICDDLLTKCVCIRSRLEAESVCAKTARAAAVRSEGLLTNGGHPELPVNDCIPCLRDDRRVSILPFVMGAQVIPQVILAALPPAIDHTPVTESLTKLPEQSEVKVVRGSFLTLPAVARKHRYVGNTVMRYIFRRKQRYIGRYLMAWVHEKKGCGHQCCGCTFVVEGVGEMKGYFFSTRLCTGLFDVADDITSKYHLLKLGDQVSVVPVRSVPVVLHQRVKDDVSDPVCISHLLFSPETELEGPNLSLPGVPPSFESPTLLWDRVKDMAQRQRIEYILFGRLKFLLGRGFGKSRLRMLLREKNVRVTTLKTVLYEIMCEIVSPCSVKVIREVCRAKGVLVSEKRLKKELEELNFFVDKNLQNHSVVGDRSRVPRRDIYYGDSDNGNNEKNDLVKTPWGARFVVFGPLIGVLLEPESGMSAQTL